MQQQIDDLKQELALALQSRDILQAQLTARLKRDSKCYLLEAIPVEVRIEIYRCLLKNPILGEPNSINNRFDSGYGSEIKYGLTPGILNTCHRIYNEASSIIYGENTFFIACIEGHISKGRLLWGAEWEEYINVSPLTRHWNDVKTRNDHIKLENIPAFARVKHWKVLISQFLVIHDERYRFSWSLSGFCRAICHSAPEI